MIEGLSQLPNPAWTEHESLYRVLLRAPSPPMASLPRIPGSRYAGSNHEISRALEDYFVVLSNRTFCIAFSGGIDSSLLAMAASKSAGFFTIAADSGAKDAIRSRQAAAALGIEFDTIPVAENLLLETIEQHKALLVELPNYTHRILAVCEIILCGIAKRRGECLVTGHGPEAILGGFRRHPVPSLDDANRIWEGLAANVSRLNIVAHATECEIHLPFLHPDVFSVLVAMRRGHSATLQHCNSKLKLGDRLQLCNISGFRADVLQSCSLSPFDLVAMLQSDTKSALQNGSGVHRLIVRAAKRSGFRFVRDYFESLLS